MKQQSLPKDTVMHVAKLANLPLDEKEIDMFAVQLGETISYVAMLDEVDTNGVEPTSQVTGLVNVLDKDTPRPSFSNDVALRNTKSKQNGSFKVKAIF